MKPTAEGLTLEGLAERLEALKRENAELRHEVATLRDSATRHIPDEESTSQQPPTFEEGRVSRKWLLSRAGAAAAGVVVAGALTQRDIREARAATEQTSGITDTPAVKGTHTNGGTGVYGVGQFGGRGVYGEGLYGVNGHSNGATGQGVHGVNSTAGDGVLGDSQGGAAIRGRSFGSTGAGVHGEHFASGYGGQFKGGKAQLRLVPGTREGRPRGGTHQKGEIYMGSKGALFVCVSGGTPGRWRKVSTTAV